MEVIGWRYLAITDSTWYVTRGRSPALTDVCVGWFGLVFCVALVFVEILVFAEVASFKLTIA